MKQITFSLLTVLMCFMTTKVNAYDIVVPNEDGLKIYYNFINNKTELSVTFYSLVHFFHNGEVYRNAEAYCGNIKIPSEVNYDGKKYKVTEIGNRAFYHCNNISIEMPDYLRSVSSSALESASVDVVKASDFRIWCETDFGSTNPFIKANKVIINDKDFVLPSELVVNCSKIGNYAFKESNQIKKVTMTESVKTIGVSAFYDCI